MSDSKTVISVTERATKAVAAAAGNLSKVVSELQTLAEGSEKVSQEIQLRQQELGQIETQYSEKLAEEKSKLKIKVLENEEGTLNALLKARGLVSVSPDTLATLSDQLATAERDNSNAIAEAVSEAKRVAAIDANSRIASVEATHKIAVAELNANSKAKDSRITDLEKQVADLQDTVKAERETRLEIAKAEAGRQGVVVNAGKQ